MKKHNPVITQVRLPDKLHRQIKELSNDTGDSMNGMMLNLMYLGLRMYKEGVIIQHQQE